MNIEDIRTDCLCTEKLIQRSGDCITKHSNDNSKSNNQNVSELVNLIGGEIFKLTKLPVGWDGHGGISVKVANASFAQHLVSETIQCNSPRSSVVRGSDGTFAIGMVYEWF